MSKRLFSREVVQEAPEVSELKKILKAMPNNSAERYMAHARGSWERWSARLVDFYGKCSAEQRIVVEEAFAAQFAHIFVHLPKDLHVVEIVWDLGQKSTMFREWAHLFHALMRRWQTALTPEEFQRDIVNRLRDSSIPRTEWEKYDNSERVPSREAVRRVMHAQRDLNHERQLLEKHLLPDDPDEMVHMLKKMKKAKMGLPQHWPDFLVQLEAKYSQSPDWPDVQTEINKIREKHQEWAAAQIVAIR